jgi:hypothetical protein
MQRRLHQMGTHGADLEIRQRDVRIEMLQRFNHGAT